MSDRLTDDDLLAAVRNVLAADTGPFTAGELLERIRNIVNPAEPEPMSMDEAQRRGVRLRAMATQLAHWQCRREIFEPEAEASGKLYRLFGGETNRQIADTNSYLLEEARYHEHLWTILLHVAERAR